MAWIKQFGTSSLLVLLSYGACGCQSQVLQPARLPNLPRAAPYQVPATTAPADPFPATQQPASEGSWSQLRKQPSQSVISLPQSRDEDARYHTVQAGENWTVIARQYGLSVDQLTQANGLTSASPLQAGQSLFIPVGQ